MARLAFDSIAGIEVSDIELARGGSTYTIDTVTELERDGSETVLVMGPTAAAGLSTWHRARELAQRVTIAVIQPTGGIPCSPARLAHHFGLHGPAGGVRNSGPRAAARDPAGRRPKATLARLVPLAVMSYIADHKLYSA